MNVNEEASLLGDSKKVDLKSNENVLLFRILAILGILSMFFLGGFY